MKKLLIFFVLLLSVLLVSSTNKKNDYSNINELKTKVEEFGKDPSLKTASWGVVVYDVQSGNKLLSVNPDLSLIPASTIKIVNTGCALNILGKDFKYETILQYSGNIDDNGRLNGNIYIQGSGDPTFGSAFMDGAKDIDEIYYTWVDSIKNIGINKVNGRIIIDESVFDNELVPREWTWEDIGNYYGAGSSGFTVNENRYTVYFKPGEAVGDPVKILYTDPLLPWIDFINQLTTAKPKTGDNVYILGSPFSNTRWLTGTIPAGVEKFGVHGSMPDPAYFGAKYFHDILISEGISIKEKPTTSRILQENDSFEVIERYTIANHYSPELNSIIKRINTNSVNTYAENLLKTIAYNEQNNGTLDAGIESIKKYWSTQGIDIQGFNLYDGSGLAQKNRITPRQMAQILLAMTSSPYGESFMESLAVAGRSGTLSHLFRGMISQDILIAKSGFLSNVIAYAGYTKTRNGNSVAFVFIVNDYSNSTIMMRNKILSVLDKITQIK